MGFGVWGLVGFGVVPVWEEAAWGGLWLTSPERNRPGDEEDPARATSVDHFRA